MHYNEHKLTNEFLDSLASNSYLPYIIQPSRHTSHSRNLIDNIFSNAISNDIICGNITDTISDHLPLFLVSWNTFANPPSNKSNIFEKDWSKCDQKNFILDYFDIYWSNLLNLNEKNVDLSTNIFLNAMNSLLNEYAPFKRISKYILKFKTKPWITFGIQKSISVKNKLLKKFIKKYPQIKAECHGKYKKYRNLLSTLLKESKQIYYTKYFESNWNNIRNTWKGIKTIISIKNITTIIPHSIEFNNRTITDPTTMSNVLNNYFFSIAEKTKSNIKFSPKHYTDYLSSTNTNTFFLTPTDKTEISFIISSLVSHKSSGPNSIPVKILKLLKNFISQQLSDIFNTSFLTGQFPAVLKIAKVIPTHNKQYKVDYVNYRPISLLSDIEKIIEKLMYKRLSNFLDINNLIYSLKFGFRQKYSTNHALINLTESIRGTLDEGSFGYGIFVDLQKTFDTVDHKILLHKLEFYGMRGVYNDWFKSYSSDRKQFISINGYNSDLMPVICGVQQGSVLGPLLFLIYINDLHKAIRYCKVHQFADDKNLFHTNRSVKNLNKLVNHDMKQLNNCLTANKISLNVEKTELVIFNFQRKYYLMKSKLNLLEKGYIHQTQ